MPIFSSKGQMSELWGVYMIHQTSSKLPANAMLDVCCKFAEHLLPYAIMELDVCWIV